MGPAPFRAQEPALWGILAALSVKHGNLHTAEAAYASIDESDKLPPAASLTLVYLLEVASTQASF